MPRMNLFALSDPPSPQSLAIVPCIVSREGLPGIHVTGLSEESKFRARGITMRDVENLIRQGSAGHVGLLSVPDEGDTSVALVMGNQWVSRACGIHAGGHDALSALLRQEGEYGSEFFEFRHKGVEPDRSVSLFSILPCSKAYARVEAWVDAAWIDFVSDAPNTELTPRRMEIARLMRWSLGTHEKTYAASWLASRPEHEANEIQFQRQTNGLGERVSAVDLRMRYREMFLQTKLAARG